MLIIRVIGSPMWNQNGCVSMSGCSGRQNVESLRELDNYSINVIIRHNEKENL